MRKDNGMKNAINFDCIEPCLYLGNVEAARDVKTLGKLKITHILTIDNRPLPRSISNLKNISTKYIEVSDVNRSNILKFFDETCSFIEAALASGGRVLVHCQFGISRSATLVLAYEMKHFKLSFSEAFNRVKSKRNVCPNEGFIMQLKLYATLNYQLDINNLHYKMFCLGNIIYATDDVRILNSSFYSLIKPDPALLAAHNSNAVLCKKCNRLLAQQSDILPHGREMCHKTYFVEPMEWMGVQQAVMDELKCPKCSMGVGFYNWKMGCECPCGVRVNPAFYLMPDKVQNANGFLH